MRTRTRTRTSRTKTRWRIAHKLTAASILMIALTLLAGGTGLWQVLVINQVTGDAREKEQQRAWSLEMLAAGHRLVAALDHMVLTEDPSLASTEIATSLGNLSFYMETMQESGGEAETADLLAEMQLAYDELRQSVSEVDVLARQELWTEADLALEQKVRPAHERMRLLIRHLVRRAEQDAEMTTAHARSVLRQAAWLLGLILMLTTAVAVGWRQFVFRTLSLSITELRQGVARISSGDLAYKLYIRTGDEIEELGNEFNKMADELADLIGNLEQRVADRTRGLQTAAEVAHATTAVLDPEELLRQVVNLVRNRFDLYYVGLFLLDEDRQFAVLRAGTGEAGRQMLEQQHRLEVGGESIISQCMARSEPCAAQDIGEEAVRFDNPFLPETRSELALPLRSRGRVIGAMTVQSAEETAFDETDIAVLQTMADQVAVAIDNARLFADAQAALEEMEATHRRYLGQAWARYLQTAGETGYETESQGIPPLGDAVWPEIQQAIARKEVTVLQSDSPAPPHSAVVAPILLRDVVIGALGIHDDDETRQWTDDDINLIAAVAEHMALAADNLRLIQETQASLAEAQALYHASQTIGAAASPEEVGQALVDFAAAGRVDAVRILLFEHDEQGRPTHMVMREGWTADDRPVQPHGACLSLQDYPLRDLMHPHEPIIVEDVLTDPRANEMTRTLIASISGLRSFAIVPITIGERWIGALFVGRNEPSTFADELIRSYMTLTGQAAVALESMRLLEETRRRAERERLTRELTARMHETLDVDTILQTAVFEMRQALGIAEVEARLDTARVLRTD